ncbi:hypothetical protein [Mycetocola tolaasinivorans]|nr:hypothetical protein [Mycetocola tolaasinivorans]
MSVDAEAFFAGQARAILESSSRGAVSHSEVERFLERVARITDEGHLSGHLMSAEEARLILMSGGSPASSADAATQRTGFTA